MTASMRQHTCLETQQMADERSRARLVPVPALHRVRGVGRAGSVPHSPRCMARHGQSTPSGPRGFHVQTTNPQGASLLNAARPALSAGTWGCGTAAEGSVGLGWLQLLVKPLCGGQAGIRENPSLARSP